MLNGKPLSPDNAFEHEGIQYPANWLRLTTLEEKQAIGITEVPDPEPYDDRFYWGPNNPKNLDDLKKLWISWVNNTAWNLLQKTDYMDFRQANDPTYIAPSEWITWRNAIRNQAKQTKTSISESLDITSLQSAIIVEWPQEPENN